jgi:hypothetical protein
LEAESADSIVSPLEVANDTNASGGKYLYAPNGTGNFYYPGAIRAVYEVNISQSGKYILWGRVKVLDKKDNSFFVQFNYGLKHYWEVAPGNHWHWDQVNNNAGLDPVIFNLIEGMNTINVILREDGTKLDKMLLTNDLNYVPSEKGDVKKP